MKKSILFLGGLALLLGSSLSSCSLFPSDTDQWGNVKYIPVQVSNSKWSFVNSDGKVILEDEFKAAPTIVCDGLFVTSENGKYTVNKLDGNRYDVLGDLEGLNSVGRMRDGLIPANSPDQRIYVYDKKGHKKFELGPVGGVEVDESAIEYSDGMLAFRLKDGKCGYVNTNGEVAVKPVYDDVCSYSEGLAVVMKYNSDNRKTTYYVINKKGELVFQVKEEHEPVSWDDGSVGFHKGYLRAKDGDRYVLYTKKGEVKKFSAKLSNIIMVDGKYMIFAGENGEYGVAKISDEEVVIKPKYKNMEFAGSNKFLAIKDGETVMLDKDGNEEVRFDYKDIISVGKFGYVGKDGSRYCLIDESGKHIGKDDFYNIRLSRCYFSTIESDYTEPINITANNNNSTSDADDFAYFNGFVGKNLAVQMRVDFSLGTTGKYCYEKYGPSNSMTLQIISFSESDYHLVMNEYTPDGEMTGTWDGYVCEGTYCGTATFKNGRTMEFYLDEVPAEQSVYNR